jgi:hypothetical protein
MPQPLYWPLLSAQIHPLPAENPHVSALHSQQVHDRESTQVAHQIRADFSHRIGLDDLLPEYRSL